jgi:hypothetical protein
MPPTAPPLPPDCPPPERRRGPDRRRRPTPWMSRHWLTGRRRGARRADEAAGYVDRYTAGEAALIVAIILACTADLYLTLDYLRQGGEEWNPLMAHALELGEGVFIGVKMGITVAGLLVLLLRVRFRGVRRALQVILLLYGGLLCWHAAVRAALPEAGARAVAPAMPSAAPAPAPATTPLTTTSTSTPASTPAPDADASAPPKGDRP